LFLSDVTDSVGIQILAILRHHRIHLLTVVVKSYDIGGRGAVQTVWWATIRNGFGEMMADRGGGLAVRQDFWAAGNHPFSHTSA
jgi:hypothetical protein